MAALASWWLLALFVPFVVLVASSASYRITIGRGAVDVAGIPFGWPRVQVPLDQVRRADAGTVEAWDFGGYGLRLGMTGQTAVVTRSGPALVVTRTDDAVLRVSLDEPDEAAAVLSTLLDRRADR
jgi:hypothetical protein